MKVLSTVVAFLIASNSMAADTKGEKIKIIAPDAAPQAMSVPQLGLSGITVDVTLAACKRAKLQCEMYWLPWARAQYEATTSSDMLVAGLSRIPDRENQYVWIGPIFKMYRAFVTLGASVDSYDQAKATLKHIAVANGTPQYFELKKAGFSDSQLSLINYHPAGNETLQKATGRELEMMYSKTIDGWFHNVPGIMWALKVHPEFASKFTIGKSLLPTEQYVACSKKCKPEIIEGMKKALEELRADGSIDKIVKKYR